MKLWAVDDVMELWALALHPEIGVLFDFCVSEIIQAAATHPTPTGSTQPVTYPTLTPSLTTPSANVTPSMSSRHMLRWWLHIMFAMIRIMLNITREDVQWHCRRVHLIKQTKLRLSGHEAWKVLRTIKLLKVWDDGPRGVSARRWSDDIAYWCGCTLPEVVQLALKMIEWRKITGFNVPRRWWVLNKKNSFMMTVPTGLYWLSLIKYCITNLTILRI